MRIFNCPACNYQWIETTGVGSASCKKCGNENITNYKDTDAIQPITEYDMSFRDSSTYLKG